MHVQRFKQTCMNESPWHLTPLKINVDFAHITNSCKIDDPIGFRMSTFDGEMLDDSKTIGSQVADIDTVFKLVFMKQYDLNTNEKAMCNQFADAACRTSALVVTMPQYGTEFVVEPVWGSEEKSRDILGIIYQHRTTYDHCELLKRGVDPMQVDHLAPVVFRELG